MLLCCFYLFGLLELILCLNDFMIEEWRGGVYIDDVLYHAQIKTILLCQDGSIDTPSHIFVFKKERIMAIISIFFIFIAHQNVVSSQPVLLCHNGR